MNLDNQSTKRSSSHSPPNNNNSRHDAQVRGPAEDVGTLHVIQMEEPQEHVCRKQS